MDSFAPTQRTTLKRLPKRGVYDRAAVYAILDEGFICHVGFNLDSTPAVIPTAYGRSGDKLYIHGSAGSRMQRTLAGGVELCIAVTLVDGLVLARSAFHHSINYRSVVVFGKGRAVTDPQDKLEGLHCVSEHITPGRWAEVRPPTAKEIAQTSVLCVDLDEVSAKVRTGPPIDDEEDYALPVWAGVLPLSIATGPPVDDGRVLEHVALPLTVAEWRRRR